MNLTWHIVRKDFQRFRYLLLAWIAFLVVKVLFFTSIAGVFGSPNDTLLNALSFGMPLGALVSIISPLFVLFLAAALIFEDAPTARDPFWVTRPISGGQMLRAKLAGSFLLLIVPILLAGAAWWWACGITVSTMLSFAAWIAECYAVIVLVGLACASATNGYPRFIVWLVAGLAAFLGVHFFATIFQLSDKKPNAWSFQVGVLAVCLALISLEILLNRFLARKFRASLAIAVGLTLVGSAWLFSFAPAAMIAWLKDAPPVFPGEDQITVSISGEVRSINIGGLVVPLRIEHVPDNVVVNADMQAVWRAADGRQWTTKSGRSNFRSMQRQTARRVLGLPADPAAPSAALISFYFMKPQADRIAAAANSVEGNLTLHLNEARPVAEVPVENQVFRFAGGSLTISQAVRNDGDVSFLLTTRSELGPERYYGVGYVALLNRRTGELIEASQDIPRLWHPLPDNHDVSLGSFWLRFKVPDRAWLNEARFVLVEMGPGHSITLPVAAATRTPGPAELVHPAHVTVSPELIREYSGTYQPRPGAKLTFESARGLVNLADNGFYKVLLFPDSNTRFRARGQSWMFATDGDYVIEFKRDAAGNVTHFTVEQNGREYVVPRITEPK